MPTDLSDNTRANYRSQRNRIQKGIEGGFYTEAEIPLARKRIDEINDKLGETNDTIRAPGRPRSALRMPKGGSTTHQSPEVTMEKVGESDVKLERIKRMADESRQRWEEERGIIEKGDRKA